MRQPPAEDQNWICWDGQTQTFSVSNDAFLLRRFGAGQIRRRIIHHAHLLHQHMGWPYCYYRACRALTTYAYPLHLRLPLNNFLRCFLLLLASLNVIPGCGASGAITTLLHCIVALLVLPGLWRCCMFPPCPGISQLTDTVRCARTLQCDTSALSLTGHHQHSTSNSTQNIWDQFSSSPKCK
jgi:hypothetical protein